MEFNMQENRWVTTKRKNFKTHLYLFCFPYAGAGASIFNNWQQFMPDGIEICAIQLPGRENRIDEQPFTNIIPLVDAMYNNLQPYFHRIVL